MSTMPEPQSTGGYEFNDEQSRIFSGLAESMRMVATLCKLLALVLLVALGLIFYKVVEISIGWPGLLIIGVVTLGVLAIGFWTSSAANSFRKIAESKNRDVWHLINAVQSLTSMYSLLRTLIQMCIVVAILAAAFAAYEVFLKPGLTPPVKTPPVTTETK